MTADERGREVAEWLWTREADEEDTARAIAAAIHEAVAEERAACAALAEVERLRTALVERERQLALAVAGMGQGRDASIFVVRDYSGRFVDIGQAAGSATLRYSPPAVLVPVVELEAMRASFKAATEKAGAG